MDWSKEWSDFKEGDLNSFRHIYDFYFDRLYRYGSRLTTDIQLLEDSIQELFLTLFTNRKNLSDTDNVEFYLLKALKWTIYGNLRKEKFFASKNREIDDFHLEFLVDSEEPEAIDQEKIELIKQSFKSLKPEAKEILYLKFYQNLDYRQIGEILGIQPDSAKKQVYRIISSLKKILSNKLLELFFLCSRA